MMIELYDILSKYGLTPTGVIHVGSHYGQEYPEYKRCGIKNIVFIEPCKDAFDVVSKIDDENVICINVACGEVEDELPMYVSHQNQGQSNSLLKPGLHTEQHPEVVFDDAEIVKVVPLDNLPIIKDKYDMLVMDVQGAEGLVLKGAKETLKNIKIIYTEINRDYTYENNMLIGEMEEFLKPFGFKLIEQYWPSPSWSWGDGIFIHE